jgi:peptidoglycan/LPS O-acetylase OafA/YrhL
MTENPPVVNREIWLDGLRGVAALIVAFFHLTTGSLNTPYRSFWDSPASENRHLIQIAPFRVVIAGQAMVDIFFVVSGYSISTGLIKLRNEGSVADFYRKLTSSVIRRMFRLCFPVAVMMGISHVLFYAGTYNLEFGEGQGCPGATPWGNPIPHVQCIVRSFVSVVNLQSGQDLTLNNHLWTIPVEIRGSMKVYLALLGLATVSDMARLLAVGLLAVRSWWNGEPEFLAFFTGLLFAELNASASRKLSHPRLLSPLALQDLTKSTPSKATWTRLTTFARYYVFVLGLYLLCLPVPVWHEGATTPTFSPDWFFLSVLPPLPWWDWEIKMRTWHTIGAILAINSMRSIPRLRAPFETRIAQFLGFISFSLYLCHQTVYRIMLNRVLNWTCLGISGINYWEAKNSARNGIVFVVWVVATGVIGTVLILGSRWMARTVDQRSVSIGFWVEKMLCRF